MENKAILFVEDNADDEALTPRALKTSALSRSYHTSPA